MQWSYCIGCQIIAFKSQQTILLYIIIIVQIRYNEASASFSVLLKFVTIMCFVDVIKHTFLWKCTVCIHSPVCEPFWKLSAPIGSVQALSALLLSITVTGQHSLKPVCIANTFLLPSYLSIDPNHIQVP
jgi:hypothetical protein